MLRCLRSLVACLLLSPAIALSAVEDFLGDWRIMATTFAFGGAPAPLELSIEEANGELEAFVSNGPVPIRIENDRFEIELDWITLFDTLHTSTLRGRLTAEGTLEGSVLHHGDQNFLGTPMQDGSFTGARVTRRVLSRDEKPRPVDLTGVWDRAYGRWPVRKMHFATTAAGQAVIDAYDDIDNPNSRCASPGLVLMTSFLPKKLEILPAGDYLVIAYGAEYVRRIYLDDREFPDDAVSSPLGFSTGQWQGDTLVVTTRHLTPAFMSSRGQPVSSDARVIEHFWLDDRGYLVNEMWVHDDVNYSRPPYYRRTYDRDFSPSVVTTEGCDPYSFFRAMFLDGRLDEFWSRADRRR